METCKMCITINHLHLKSCCVLLLGLCFSTAGHTENKSNPIYGFGSKASTADIAKIDIDVMPDGRGAPLGQGNYKQGKKIYVSQCAACHGIDMAKPTKGTGAPALRGGRGSLTSNHPKKTVESYWPYASTLFDYIKRAMPFNAPGSMSNNEVYAVTAYILAEGKIIDRKTVIDAKAIAKIKMPNRNGFIADPRPEKFGSRQGL